MTYLKCRAAGPQVRFLILCSISLCVLTAGASLLRLPVGLVALSRLASSTPPEVPHDGIRVVQPLDAAELAKCPKGKAGSGMKLIEERASLGTPAPTSKASASFLLSRKREEAANRAHRYRMTFACTAGCSAREPQLENSLAPWADWKKNSSGLDMINALEGFCNAERTSPDPFIMTVLWKGDVFLKGCKSDGLQNAGLYLIGPEDLSLVLIFLFSAQRIATLPDGPIAFGMYLSDYTSLLDRHLAGPGLPVFSYLGRDTSWLIPWPSSFTVMSTQDTETWEQEQKKKATQKSWDKRESKAFWIGAITGPWEFSLDAGLLAVPRLKLLKMAKENPKQLHAEWSSTAGYGISWVQDDKNVSGFLAKRSHSIEELTGIAPSDYKGVDSWQNFKYYLNLDGVVLGGRLNKLLSLGGVVLQQQAGYVEHIDGLLKPYEHYVPVAYDLSDLVEKVQWLQQNEAEAKRIAQNGKDIAMKRMRLEDHLCYIWRALEGLGVKTASAKTDDYEVAARLQSFQKVAIDAKGMRETMEAFWGSKLEKVATGNREMTTRGIELLQWAWDRMKDMYEQVQHDL